MLILKEGIVSRAKLLRSRTHFPLSASRLRLHAATRNRKTCRFDFRFSFHRHCPFARRPPQDERYAALSRAYLDCREKSQEGGSSDISDGSLIREGDTDRRVPRIAEMLRQGGYLEEAAGGPMPGSRAGRSRNCSLRCTGWWPIRY